MELTSLTRGAGANIAFRFLCWEAFQSAEADWKGILISIYIGDVILIKKEYTSHYYAKYTPFSIH